MKNKKVFIILAIIVILILIGFGIFMKYNINLITKIESKLDLTEAEKEELNYEDLIEDIKSLENGNKIINAKQDERNIFKYEGDGYTIEVMGGRRM